MRSRSSIHPLDDDTTNISSLAPMHHRVSARIVALTGPNIGRTWPVRDAAIAGRSRSTDIRLDDADVSRRHIRIRRRQDEEDDWELEDLGSRNGTLLNGHPATQTPLRYGDRIQIGSTVLQFTRSDHLEDDLQQSQRMEALGRLAGGIAHDFNNLIVVVLGNLNYMQGILDEPTDDLRDCLSDAEAALARMSELTGQLLGFARRGKYEERWLDVSKLVDEAVRLCRRTFDRGITIDTDLTSGLGVVGDPSQLMQVLVNLCLNARDAIGKQGTLTVTTRLAEPEQLTASSFSPDASTYVVISLQDSGAGMDEETKRRIFEPFFTTKTSGTGLGLSMVYGIVNSHQGHVHVESAPGEGTTFLIYLPAAKPPRPPEPLPLRAPSRPPQAEARILLVEDEDLLRRTSTRLLESFGYTVLSARDGQEALDRFDEEGGRFDLVILDLIMPVMDGEQTFEALRSKGATLPILLTTGHAEQDRARALLEQGAQLLRKPHDARTLRRLVAQALGEE